MTNRRARQTLSRSGGGYVGSYDLDLEAVQSRGAAQVSGSYAYYANRAELGASHAAIMRAGTDRQVEQRSSLRTALSLAFANGTFGIGRPINDEPDQG